MHLSPDDLKDNILNNQITTVKTRKLNVIPRNILNQEGERLVH